MTVDNDHDFSVTASQSGGGGAHVIAVAGQADLHTAPELRETIAAAIDDGARRVVIDLTDATFIDSMTLGVLLGALKRLSPLSGELAIVCPDHHLRRVFEITSLDRVLTLTDTRSAALEHLNVASGGVQ